MGTKQRRSKSRTKAGKVRSERNSLRMERKKIEDNYRRIFTANHIFLLVIPVIGCLIYITGLMDVSAKELAIVLLLLEAFQLFYILLIKFWLCRERGKTSLNIAPVVIYWTITCVGVAYFSTLITYTFITALVCIAIAGVTVFGSIGSKVEFILFYIFAGGMLLVLNLLRGGMDMETNTYLAITIVLLGIIYIYRNQSYMRHLAATVEIRSALEEAETDPMTELLNVRGMEHRLAQTWELCKRSNKEVSVIMIDIDNFKKYNDSFGHLAGDECIKAIATQIKECVRRSSDFAARVGGEEFLMFLSGADAKQALSRAKELKASVEELRLPHTSTNFLPYVSISIGIYAERPEHSTQFFELRNKADQALYRAKEAGRACICKGNQIYAQTKPEASAAVVYNERGFRPL